MRLAITLAQLPATYCMCRSHDHFAASLLHLRTTSHPAMRIAPPLAGGNIVTGTASTHTPLARKSAPARGYQQVLALHVIYCKWHLPFHVFACNAKAVGIPSALALCLLCVTYSSPCVQHFAPDAVCVGGPVHEPHVRRRPTKLPSTNSTTSSERQAAAVNSWRSLLEPLREPVHEQSMLLH